MCESMYIYQWSLGEVGSQVSGNPLPDGSSISVMHSPSVGMPPRLHSLVLSWQLSAVTIIPLHGNLLSEILECICISLVTV